MNKINQTIFQRKSQKSQKYNSMSFSIERQEAFRRVPSENVEFGRPYASENREHFFILKTELNFFQTPLIGFRRENV